MSDEKKSAEWHEKQAAQFKQELDQLNPRLNVAQSRIKELEAIAALFSKEKADLRKVCETTDRVYAETRGNYEQKIAELHQQIEHLERVLAAEKEARGLIENELELCRKEKATLQASNSKLLAGLNLSLDALSKSVKAVTEAIQGAV